MILFLIFFKTDSFFVEDPKTPTSEPTKPPKLRASKSPKPEPSKVSGLVKKPATLSVTNPSTPRKRTDPIRPVRRSDTQSIKPNIRAGRIEICSTQKESIGAVKSSLGSSRKVVGSPRVDTGLVRGLGGSERVDTANARAVGGSARGVRGPEAKESSKGGRKSSWTAHISPHSRSEELAIGG